MTDYGRDISCTDDCDAMFSERDGSDVVLLSESIFRRLITPKGRLLEDTLYGNDVHQWLNASVDSITLARIGAGIVAECHKDERVESVTVNITTSGPPGSLTLTIDISGVALSGPFKLTIGVDSVTVELLSTGV